MQTLAPTWNLGSATSAKWYVRLFPSLNDIAFLLPIVALFTRMNGTQLLFSDGDTGWHIRTGEWILAHHAVPTTDLFSFTKSDKAWFAWEWAWDVPAAIIHRYLGLGGIGFITTIMLGIFTLLVYQLALRLSHNDVMSIVVTAFAAAVSSIHWLARPHLVSWIFTLVFLNVLESARAEAASTKYLLSILLPVLAMIWANMHGGFVAGLLIIACYGLGEMLTSMMASTSSDVWLNARLGWKTSAIYWQSLTLCAGATLINPYGWQLHKHIVSYLTDSELLNNIQEFQSISFHAGPAVYLEIVLLLAGLAVYQNLQAGRYTPVLLMCFWAHFALVSARHIPLFVMVAAPFLAALLGSGLMHACRVPSLSAVSETISDICKDLRSIESTPRLHLLSGAGLVLIAGLFAIGQPPFAPRFNPEVFPVQAVPVLQVHPRSRIFTTDQWGDYLLYTFYPSQRVFFDGRSDFYGNDFVKVNQRIAGAEHDWKTLLQRYSIDLVMVKPETPLSAVLKLTAGSKVLFDDGKVIVFDISQILDPASRQFLGQGKVANRAASLSHSQQTPSGKVAMTAKRPNKIIERKS
jgi:hypothetical protein